MKFIFHWWRCNCYYGYSSWNITYGITCCFWIVNVNGISSEYACTPDWYIYCPLCLYWVMGKYSLSLGWIDALMSLCHNNFSVLLLFYWRVWFGWLAWLVYFWYRLLVLVQGSDDMWIGVIYIILSYGSDVHDVIHVFHYAYIYVTWKFDLKCFWELLLFIV